MANRHIQVRRVLMTGVALATLAACEDFDFDLRDMGNGFDTSSAVQQLPGRPRPDDRGVISYPNYQVVVARQDDTIRGIAIRLGLNPDELAAYNGVETDAILRRDEIIALPIRVAEPSPATGAVATGPIQPLDVSAIATSALDRADASGTVVSAPLAPTTAAPTPVPAPPKAAAPAAEAPKIPATAQVPVSSPGRVLESEEAAAAAGALPRWWAAFFVVIPAIAIAYALFLPNGPNCGDAGSLAIDPVTGLAVNCDGSAFGSDEVDLFSLGAETYTGVGVSPATEPMAVVLPPSRPLRTVN